MIKTGYSKTQVQKAGDYLVQDIDETFDVEKYLECYNILHYWRASHVYPMQSTLMYLRKKSFEIDKDALVVQRLKRTPSILSKLERETGMSLARMEDIAGCRVVVTTQKNAYDVRDQMKNGKTRNTLHRSRDYISTPKESGYRGLHLIYKYNGTKTECIGKFVEIQIRSKVQHSWATAVEVVGTFSNQALKASQGSESWIRFFKLCSIAFADIENNLVTKNKHTPDRLELIKLTNDLNVLQKLTAFAVVTTNTLRNTDPKTKVGFYLLVLDVSKATVELRRFGNDEYAKASSEYDKYELEYKDDLQKDVVLVSASSIHNLKKAYPNYFADTGEFAKHLNRIIAIGLSTDIERPRPKPKPLKKKPA